MKGLRLIFVLVIMIGLVSLGTTGVSWAARLTAGNQQPMSEVPNNDLPAGSRPAGTVSNTPTCVHTIKPGNFVVGRKATWSIGSTGFGGIFSACIVSEGDLPAKVPGSMLTSPVKLSDSFGTTLGASQTICFPVPPGKTGIAYYWKGKAWAKSENAKGGQACVTIPASAPNPTYVVLGEVK